MPTIEVSSTNKQLFSQFENNFKSTNPKWQLLNGFGSKIKVISENLDDNDLSNMNNMNKLLENQNLLESRNSKTLPMVRNITVLTEILKLLEIVSIRLMPLFK